MKKFALLLLTLALATTAFAEKKQLSALFGYSAFYIPGSNQPYVETYLNFNAWTLDFKKVEKDQYRATVEVTLVVRKDSVVSYLKKYDLNSPVTTSDTAVNFTFFDLQRFGLANGIYDLELTLRDKNSKNAPTTYTDKMVVFFQQGKPSMSNIQLMSSATPTVSDNMLSRNGYDMVPYINDFVPANITALNPYVEIYNLDREISDKNQNYSIKAYIQKKENGRRIEGFSTTVQHNNARQIDPVFLTLDISKLPSGNYDLFVEVLNQNDDVLLKKDITFMRSNPKVIDDAMSEDNVATSFAALITDEAQLNYYLNALYPIASESETQVARNLARTQNNLVEKQTFFYRFWLMRNPISPETEWNKYLALLTYVDENFSYPRTPGYMTDRGRVYLQYGPPDHIRDEKNFVGMRHFVGSSANRVDQTTVVETISNENGPTGHGSVHYLPYQLWRYNMIEGEKPNSVFLFWDELRSGYYKLLNSSVIKEIHTPFWERALSQKQLEEDAVGEVGEQFERGY